MELDHVGVAVADLEVSLARWAPLLGRPETVPEEVPSQRVRVAFLRVGDTHVELVAPLSPESAVGKFLASRGEGVHHLAFRVPSVARALDDLVQRNERVVDRAPRTGARGRTVGFAHPSAFGGVLVEFVEGP